jgi:cellulose synthase/poly-beta-1,6-N-acetylglucosamine synthase-like glycosyltransferase
MSHDMPPSAPATPQVSVVIPIYNEAENLPGTSSRASTTRSRRPAAASS